MAGNPNPQRPPKPVTLAMPGVLSPADFAQLHGLTVPDKILQMRGILTGVRATRTLQQVAQFGQFSWDEAVGPSGEMLFIGPAPPTVKRRTVVVIMTTGEVYAMFPVGLTGLISQGPPKVVGFDLQKGQAQLMAS
jgi:hypothetical protein